MDILFFIFSVCVFLFLLFVLPLLILYFSWVKTKYVKYLVALLFAIYCYEWWRAFYPEDDYFKSQFEYISGIELPKSAKVIHKSASFPDLHGDFDSCFVISLSKQELQKLLDKNQLESVDEERSCNSSKRFRLVNKGTNKFEYEFMSWYLTEEGLIWGYYAQY